MITDQVVNNHDDMHKVTDNMLREVGLTIDDSGGQVTFAGAEPVRKTTMKAGAAPAIILAANAVAEAAIWKERTGEGQDIHVAQAAITFARSRLTSPTSSSPAR